MAVDEFFIGLEGIGEALAKRRLASIDPAVLSVIEQRRRKPKPRGGGGGGHAHGTRFSGPRPMAAPKQMLARAPLAMRHGLAGGSQAAVVKLASYAGGSRTSALMAYQSRNGEIELEREDGSRVGGDQVKALAAEWAEASDKREPSKDVLRLELTVEHPERVDIAEAVANALPGHRYAWRREGPNVSIVATAASSIKTDGRSERIYDNKKSLAALELRFAKAFSGGGAVAMEAQGFAHGVEGATRFLSRLTRGGKEAATTSTGATLQGSPAVLELAKSWKRDLRSREQRDVAHIILSAKPGTNEQAFTAAARATLAREFEGHEYAFALHTDRSHVHIHAVVRMTAKTGERIDPKIGDFKRWRATLAEEARERAIPMEAASRFESANPPGYKLKDARRVERGEASATTRQRVDAVRGGAVHVPTRPEGRQRAGEALGNWRELAETPVGSGSTFPEPPLQPGSLRLYRAQTTSATRDKPLFTTERAAAELIAKRRPDAHLVYLDITQELRRYISPSARDPERVFLVETEVAQRSRPLETVEKSNILRYVSRTELAVREAGELDAQSKEQHAMPRIENIAEAKVRISAHIETIDALLTDQKAKDALHAAHADIQEKMDKALALQKRVDADRGEIIGERYVKPALRNLSTYVAEERGETVRYSHRLSDNVAGRTAFVDTGAKVEVRDWRDREATLAAMQLASEKWKDGLTVQGPPKYQAMVVTLAAEHGIKIANPELQERLVLEKARIEKEREALPGFKQAGSIAIDRVDAKPEVSDQPTQPVAEKQQKRVSPVTKMVETIREVREAQGIAGHRYEDVRVGLEAILAARLEALAATAPAQRLKFMRQSKDFAVDNLPEEMRSETATRIAEVDAKYLRDVPAKNIPDQSGSSQTENGALPLAQGSKVVPAKERASLQGSGVAAESAPVRTEFERNAELDSIRTQVHAEAARETREADLSAAGHETPIAPNYRSQDEAAEARQDDRVIENNVRNQMPTTSADSPRMQQLGDEQRAVLNEEEASRQAEAQKQRLSQQKPRGQRM